MHGQSASLDSRMNPPDNTQPGTPPQTSDGQVSAAHVAGFRDNQQAPKLDPIAKLPKIVHFDELARCGEEIWIENGGQIYRLRRTRQGKLILTK